MLKGIPQKDFCLFWSFCSAKDQLTGETKALYQCPQNKLLNQSLPRAINFTDDFRRAGWGGGYITSMQKTLN